MAGDEKMGPAESNVVEILETVQGWRGRTMQAMKVIGEELHCEVEMNEAQTMPGFNRRLNEGLRVIARGIDQAKGQGPKRKSKAKPKAEDKTVEETVSEAKPKAVSETGDEAVREG